MKTTNERKTETPREKKRFFCVLKKLSRKTKWKKIRSIWEIRAYYFINNFFFTYELLKENT